MDDKALELDGLDMLDEVETLALLLAEKANYRRGYWEENRDDLSEGDVHAIEMIRDELQNACAYLA